MSYGHKLWDKVIEFADKSSWSAGSFLAKKMRINDFASNERVIVALVDDEIVSYSIFVNQDDLPLEYGFTPFVGFVFVDEKYRGNRLSFKMIDEACNIARLQNFSKIYITSRELGLYEKYGFTKIGEYKTIFNTVEQLFCKEI